VTGWGISRGLDDNFSKLIWNRLYVWRVPLRWWPTQMTVASLQSSIWHMKKNHDTSWNMISIGSMNLTREMVMEDQWRQFLQLKIVFCAMQAMVLRHHDVVVANQNLRCDPSIPNITGHYLARGTRKVVKLNHIKYIKPYGVVLKWSIIKHVWRENANHKMPCPYLPGNRYIRVGQRWSSAAWQHVFFLKEPVGKYPTLRSIAIDLVILKRMFVGNLVSLKHDNLSLPDLNCLLSQTWHDGSWLGRNWDSRSVDVVAIQRW